MGEPVFRGVDHVALTVSDPVRSRTFYVDVLGFTAAVEQDEGVLCVHKPTGFTLALLHHGPVSDAPFDHELSGLDHLGLLASSRGELEAWAERLRQHDVPHSPITDEPLGSHLNVRDPDGIALEFFAPSAVYEAARADLRTRLYSDEELRAKATELLGLAALADAAGAADASGAATTTAEDGTS